MSVTTVPYSQCDSCNEPFNGHELARCPECGSENFQRLVASYDPVNVKTIEKGRRLPTFFESAEEEQPSNVIVGLLNVKPLAIAITKPLRVEEISYPKQVKMPKWLRRKLGRLIRHGTLPARRYTLMA